MSVPSDSPATGPIEIRDSRTFWALCSALMGSLTALSAASGGGGWVGLWLFGTRTIYTFVRLLGRRIRLRITEEGIVDQNFWYSPGLITWSEMLDVRATRWRTIEIDLVDEEAFLARLSVLARLYRIKLQLRGLGPTLIVPWGLECTRRELIEMLETGMDSYALSAVRAGDPLPCRSPPVAGFTLKEVQVS